MQIMNSVFQGSYFTIIACSGSSADSGLPGARPNSRQCSQIIKRLNPVLKMSITHSIDWHLSRSPYNKRGWTLQEFVLPRRAVIFVNNMIHFRCQEANYSEEMTADMYTKWIDPDDSNIVRLPGFHDEYATSYWAYQKLCEDYSKRDLRFSGDALRATAGILKVLASRLRSPMIEGLPGYWLDMALLFFSVDGNRSRRPQFVSFSWAGWEGKVMWPRANYISMKNGRPSWDQSNLCEWLTNSTFVHWHVYKPSADLRDLRTFRWSNESRLMTLLNDLPLPNHDKAEVDCRCGRFWSGSSSGSGIYPVYDKPRNEQPQVTTHELNLVNSQSEFDGLVQNIRERRERLSLTNWLVSRRTSKMNSIPRFRNGV